jgi:membrane-associated phospholipid phosphatase
MLSKVAAAVILIGATLINHPVHAESSGPPIPQTEVTDTVAPAKPEANREAAESSDVDSINGKYLKGYFVDTGKILASPLHWEARDWLKVGVVVGVTGSLFLIDDKVKNFAQSHKSAVASKFATVGNDLGNPLFTLPPVGAFYLYGYLADDAKARRTSLLAIESFAISGVLTNGLKMLAQRHRPNTGDSSTTWGGPKLSLSNLSFCSGHTSSAFSLATVFADQYKDNPYIPPIAYGLATLTGLSRIYSNAHWSSDAFFGAALGYFVSKAVLSYHKEDKKGLANRLTLLPQVGKEMTGVSMQYTF